MTGKERHGVMARELRILILEDVAADAELMAHELRKEGIDFTVKVVDTKDDFERSLEEYSPDLILSDYSLPSYDGISAMEMAKNRCSEAPFIFVTGAMGEERAIETLKNGATDYVLKDNLSRLAPAVNRAVREAEDRIERQRAEEALRDSEQLYRTLVQTSPEAVTMTDLEGRIIFVSPRALELHGSDDADDLLGRSAVELIAVEEHEKAIRNLEKTLQKGLVRNVEYRMIKKDGSSYIGEMNASLVQDSQGNPKAFIATTRDITDRKQAADDLARVNTELERYARTVSHDLKAPISGIEMASRILEDISKSPDLNDMRSEIIELAGLISSGTEKSVQLITELLELAQAGQEPVDLDSVDIKVIVDKVLEERAGAIEEKPISVEVDEDLGSVLADRTHMYQLFSNLIGNAILHGDNRNPVIQVSRLGAGEEGGKRFLVRDNGSGVPPEHLDDILVPFYKHDSCGSGIGLSIVEKIVRNYSGAIRVYNDGGACFEFTVRDYAQKDSRAGPQSLAEREVNPHDE